MPLARIITSMPEQALVLAERLRRSGYTVETVAPGDVPAGAADIELRLSGGNPSQVLKGIAARVAPADCDVYIASGALHSTPRPAGSSSSHPGLPSITDTMNGVAAGLQNKRDLLAKALREQRLLLRQERNAERQRLRREPRQAEVVAHEPFSSDASQPFVHREAVRFEQPERVAEVGASENRLSEPPLRPDAVAHAINGTSEEHVLLGPEPFESHEDEARSPEDRPDEISPVVLVGPPSMHDAAELRVKAAEPQEKVPFQHSPRRRKGVRVVVPGGQRLSRRAREWRAAVLISCLFAGVLMLGWTVVTREPVSPLPRSLSAETGVEQSVPFGAATLKPMAADVKTSPHAHRTAVQPSPEVAHRRPTTHATVEAAHSGSRTVTHKTEQRHRLSRSSPEDDVAEDQVIYHRSVAAPPVNGSEKASLKKFSD